MGTHIPILAGVKRHAVTLFEGGKVAGEEVIADLISELKSSISSDIKHEGEIMHLTNHASALAMVLECIKVVRTASFMVQRICFGALKYSSSVLLECPEHLSSLGHKNLPIHMLSF